MEISCSLKTLAGGTHCGLISRQARTCASQVVPLFGCSKDIQNHLKNCKFSGPSNEIELILSRVGIFKIPANASEFTICPAHRYHLGIGWSRGCNTRCRVPHELSGHGKARIPKADRGIGPRNSHIILKKTGKFLQPGSGMCTNCEKKMNQMVLEENSIEKLTHDFENVHVEERVNDPEVKLKSTAHNLPILSPALPPATPGSLYHPSDGSSSSSHEKLFSNPNRMSLETPRQHLNEFLAARGISPVRHTLETPWDEISERTKRLHTRKARQVVDACLEEIAPNQKLQLAKTVCVAYETSSSIDSTLLEALVECYSNADHWSTRRQILSIIADKVPFKELQLWIPDLTRYRFNIARHHRLLHGRGAVVSKSAATRIYVAPEKLDHFISFITSGHVVQDLPFGEKTLKLSSNAEIKVPNIIRTMIPEHIVNQYQSYCEESKFTPMSRSTLCRVLKVCSASVRKSLQGLDYFSADGAKAYDDLEEVVQKLGDEHDASLTWAKHQTEKLKQSKRYLKTDYKVHISDNSTVADHCRHYSLSLSGDDDYILPCDHEHDERCDRCDILPSVVNEIKAAIEKIDDGTEKDEIKFQVEQSTQKIQSWKAHMLRSLNQDQARLDVLERLNPTSALLVLDWAMKFLPRKYREAQSDWFGKRGISWHITVAVRKKKDGTMQILTFVHVFEKCTQDGDTVLAIIDNVFHQLRSLLPEPVTKVFLRQDNAGCYHATPVLLSLQQIAKKNNITLCQVDYSDPQGGKGPCDRKAATIKSHIKIYLNEGHDVETAEQMVTAIESRGGVPGVRVTLCEAQRTKTTFEPKWDGISFLNNFAFSEEGIRVWRAYSIGPGKFLSWNQLNTPTVSQLPIINVIKGTASSAVCFTNVTARRKVKPKSSDDDVVDTATPPLESEDDDQSLFFCTEKGCVKSYQNLSSLHHHLDCGKHQYVLERETLYDKAMVKYAAKLEEGASSTVPSLSIETTTSSSAHCSQLPMGWALKSSKTYKRLSKKQKEYLLDIYNVGSQTGQKADPAVVSKSMRKARYPSGEPMFTLEEYLSSQQIASFFSRETAKKKVVDVTTENRQPAERERLLQDIQNDVMAEISISHPIMYHNYNLCVYSLNQKLDRLSILLLQDICTSFELDISKITVRRKKPYITLIESLVNKCSCKS